LAGGRDIEPSRFGAAPHPNATPHSPLRDEFELALASATITAGIPLLGMCRGMQIVNVALGGTLHLDHSVLPPPADRHPGGDWGRWAQVVEARLRGSPPPPHPSHEVETAPGSALASALGPRATVNSYHHQSLAELGRGLVVTARAADGVIEAIELPDAPNLCLGVQWELQEEPDSPLFALFVQAARRRAGAARGGVSGRRVPAPVRNRQSPVRRASG
jgi:putative glutamine amidotransferase